jgi:hypothetical protein
MKKTSTILPRTYARGGHGPKQHMFGQGDRTKTAPADAAGPQTPNQTAQHSTERVRPHMLSDNPAGDMGGSPGQSLPRRPG